MRCPFCGHLDDKVVDSRSSQGGEAIRRRRECLRCQRRFTTYEHIEEVFPRIIKRDGSREDYERGKALRGLNLASSKRPISTLQIESILQRTEERMLELGEREIPSDWIGAALAEELRLIDPVAYLRFASVYRGFADLQSFLAEARDLEAAPRILTPPASCPATSAKDPDEP
jgi:transcriptional repressor NrdR